MLLRRDERGVLAIGQPSHAWVSGQLARAWGNERFGSVRPREEICLAAEQHDIGMAVWDLQPSFNPATGLPHGFTEMPIDVHLELWGAAARRALRQSRYAALLISMHGVRLYEMRDLAGMEPAPADAVRALMAEQRHFQHELIASLGADPVTAPDASDAHITRASDQLWCWDSLSLALCLDWAPWTAKSVPVSGGTTDVALTPAAGEQRATASTPGLPAAHRVHLDPWPFAGDAVTVRCEGQRLAERYANENELRAGLGAAPWETLTIELLPRERNA